MKYIQLLQNKPRKREMIAWVLVGLQFLALSYMVIQSSSSQYSLEALKSLSNEIDQNDLFSGYGDTVAVSVRNKDANDILINNIKMNDHTESYYKARRTTGLLNNTSYYEKPVIHPKDAGLVSRIWRSNGSPSINPGLQQGSCWCSYDEWCVCTPSLAIDLIITSGPDHIWLVQRHDTGLLALMGGFTEVGETSLDTVPRELMEEMNIVLEPTTHPRLFGVYNDPLRDTRRHTTSVVYVVDLPETIQPKAGDDAKNVVRLPIAEVERNEFFIDHKTVIRDYLKMKRREEFITAGNIVDNLPPIPMNGDEEPFRRSICPMI